MPGGGWSVAGAAFSQPAPARGDVHTGRSLWACSVLSGGSWEPQSRRWHYSLQQQRVWLQRCWQRPSPGGFTCCMPGTPLPSTLGQLQFWLLTRYDPTQCTSELLDTLIPCTYRLCLFSDYIKAGRAGLFIPSSPLLNTIFVFSVCTSLPRWDRTLWGW